MLYDLELGEVSFKLGNDVVSVAFDVGPPNQLVDVELASICQHTVQVLPETTLADFSPQMAIADLLHKGVEACLGHSLTSHSLLLLQRGDLGVAHCLDFDLNLETHPVLVLYVLRGAEALEVTIYHDSHLGAESLGLFH